MPIDEQQKSALVTNISTLVRQTQLPGIDVQRLAMAFRMTVDSLADGQAIELQPLFDYLVNELKTPEKSAIELCVILKAREQKLGVPFVPPAKAALPYLSPEQADKIIQAFNTKLERSVGTWDKSGEHAAAAMGKSSPGQPAWQPEKKKPDAVRNKTPLLLGILGISVLGAVGFWVWRQSTLEEEIHEAPPPDPGPNGLKCTKLTTNGAVAFCDIPKALATSLSDATLQAQADATKAAIPGIKMIYVRSTEENRIILVR